MRKSKTRQYTAYEQFKRVGDYQFLELLGKGANGFVYKGLDSRDGSFVAIKEMIIGKSEMKAIQTQLKFLKKLDHPKIVKHLDTLQKDNRIFLILEFVEGGSLGALVKKSCLSEDVIKIYIRQVLAGLDFLHQQGVIHRDIKGANILITKHGQVKLADFGVAVKVEESQKTISAAGSPYWLAPEIIVGQLEPSIKCDIWSLGCTVIELLTGNPPYFQLMQFPALFRIVEDEHPPLPECSPDCQQFLMKCLSKDPEKRASAGTLLDHDWLKSPNQPGNREPQNIDRNNYSHSQFLSQYIKQCLSEHFPKATKMPSQQVTILTQKAVSKLQKLLQNLGALNRTHDIEIVLKNMKQSGLFFYSLMPNKALLQQLNQLRMARLSILYELIDKQPELLRLLLLKDMLQLQLRNSKEYLPVCFNDCKQPDSQGSEKPSSKNKSIRHHHSIKNFRNKTESAQVTETPTNFMHSDSFPKVFNSPTQPHASTIDVMAVIIKIIRALVSMCKTDVEMDLHKKQGINSSVNAAMEILIKFGVPIIACIFYHDSQLMRDCESARIKTKELNQNTQKDIPQKCIKQKSIKQRSQREVDYRNFKTVRENQKIREQIVSEVYRSFYEFTFLIINSNKQITCGVSVRHLLDVYQQNKILYNLFDMTDSHHMQQMEGIDGKVGEFSRKVAIYFSNIELILNFLRIFQEQTALFDVCKKQNAQLCRSLLKNGLIPSILSQPTQSPYNPELNGRIIMSRLAIVSSLAQTWQGACMLEKQGILYYISEFVTSLAANDQQVQENEVMQLAQVATIMHRMIVSRDSEECYDINRAVQLTRNCPHEALKKLLDKLDTCVDLKDQSRHGMYQQILRVYQTLREVHESHNLELL